MGLRLGASRHTRWVWFEVVGNLVLLVFLLTLVPFFLWRNYERSVRCTTDCVTRLGSQIQDTCETMCRRWSWHRIWSRK